MTPPAPHGIQILTTGGAGLEQFAHHGTGVHPGAGRKAPCRFALRHRMDQVLPRRDARGVAFDGALRHDHLQKILSDLNTRPQARWSSLRKRRPFAVRDHRIECSVVAWHRVHHQETKRSWSMLPHVSGSSRCRTSCVCCLLRRQSRQRSTSVGQKASVATHAVRDGPSRWDVANVPSLPRSKCRSSCCTRERVSFAKHVVDVGTRLVFLRAARLDHP